MNAPLYTTEILRLAASLPDPVEFDADGSAELRSPTCGSTARVAVTLDKDGRVRQVAPHVHACAFGQAATTLMARHAVGCNRDDAAAVVETLDDWLSGERDNPGDWRGLQALAPARSRKSRHAAILLPFRALLAAIEDAR